jgi:Zn-dependent alcohol dehydrogenase
MNSFAGNTVAVIGLGLIGGSIARGLRQANPEQRILAVDNNPESIRQATAEGTIDDSGDLASICAQADIIGSTSACCGHSTTSSGGCLQQNSDCHGRGQRQVAHYSGIGAPARALSPLCAWAPYSWL